MIRFDLPEDKISLRQTLKSAVDFFILNGIDDSDYDAFALFEKAFRLSKNEYFMRQSEEAGQDERELFIEYINRRAEHIPLQVILGEAWFYGRSFFVNENVLIPRFDTEVLIEEALRYLKDGMDVLDMCTGSGCIIITLAKERAVKATGADISEQALMVAKKNAAYLGADCRFIKTDLFDRIDEKFDIIVSNPPYIRTADIDKLQKEVREHEPMLALDGGADGLDIYRRIAKEAGKYLKERGRIILEIGFDEGKEVSDLLLSYGFENVDIIRDLAGLDRVVSGIRKTAE